MPEVKKLSVLGHYSVLTNYFLDFLPRRHIPARFKKKKNLEKVVNTIPFRHRHTNLPAAAGRQTLGWRRDNFQPRAVSAEQCSEPKASGITKHLGSSFQSC